jgi:hypothetical protein
MKKILKNKFDKKGIEIMLTSLFIFCVLKMFITQNFSIKAIFNFEMIYSIIGVLIGHIFYENIYSFIKKIWNFLDIAYHRTKYSVSEFFGKNIRFVKNAFIYRSVLSDDYPYSVNMRFLQKSIERVCDYIEKYGHEEDVSRIRKIKAMKRVIYLLDVYNNDSYIEEAEKILGKKYSYSSDFYDMFEKMEDGNYLYTGHPDKKADEINTELTKFSHQLSKEHWEELMLLLKGKDLNGESYDDVYDGSDLRRWWD